MSFLLSFNGQNYIIPNTNDTGWGSNLNSFFTAIAGGALQKVGGSFTLTAETDFGASFGLKSLYYKSRAANVASAGALRLANAETGIVWRRADNAADLPLTVNSSNQLTFNGIPIESSTLTNAHILVGNVSNVAADVAMSGDVAIINTGATTIQAGAVTGSKIASGTITDTNINSAAAIAYSKLSLTTSIVNGDIATAAAIAITKIALGTANQLLGTNAGATANEWKTLSGTANQITVTHGAGTITLATSQSIATGSSPTFAGLTLSSPLTVANGGTGDASLTAYAVLCGGTTSTGAVQSIAAVGTSGQVLTSNGASALPTFKDVAGTGTVGSGTAGQLTLYNASTNAVTDTYVQNSQNIILAIAAQASRSAGLTITIPNPGNAVTAANLLLDSDTGSYTIAGAWTLSNAAGLTISPTSNQIVLGATRTVTITAPTPATSSRTWTIPDISGSGTFAALEGTQTFSGSKTFSSAVAISATSNHLVLSTSSNTLTISAATQATSARTWTVPDVSGSGTFAALEGTQTFSGAKTFSSPILGSAGSAGAPSHSFSGDTDTGFWNNTANEVDIVGNGAAIAALAPTNVSFYISGTRLVELISTAWEPVTTNNISCGASGHNWTAVWANNGTIQTSMSNTKTNLLPIEEDSAFVCKVPKPALFTRPGEDASCLRMGWLADTLPAEAHPMLEDGTRAEESVYTDSILAMHSLALRRDYMRFAAQDVRIAALEAEIAALKKNKK